jgi:two-component system phosphate regulon sensor histidine kinase PhoR
MLPAALIKGFDKQRLKGMLALFFLALAVPTGFLIWQAYGQLKWEAFHQYRGQAEELTRRVDTSLVDLVAAAESRSFADYSFLVVSGDANANLLRPSPLSAFPVTAELPGAMGHFQVDSNGTFSTPMLPQDQAEATSYGIAPAEYLSRLQAANQVQAILADNRLARSRSATPGERSVTAPAAATGSLTLEESAAMPEEESVASVDVAQRRQLNRPTAAFADDDARPAADLPTDATAYNQSVFDELNEATSFADADTASKEQKNRDNSLGRIDQLKLSADLQKKSEIAELKQAKAAPQTTSVITTTQLVRAKRLETDALAETGGKPARISTFESEIDPFQFSLLDSGHLVLFRNVWRDGDRFIQGLLLDQQTFVEAVLDRNFLGTGLSQMSDVIVAYQDDVIHTISGQTSGRYMSNVSELTGSLLYQARLSAPFDGLSLIFSVKRLPPGPGAPVLGWVTLVIAVVFLGGFYGLYRVGLSQINLARQQQDFVSAVSHELKTPLTSIRMYSEMLKDGWADAEKQQQYYEYIHDESERLTRLISNVLQLASITRNEPQLDMKPTRTGTLIDQVRSKVSSQVERAGFELQISADERCTETEISVDADCFTQIVINLIDNAIKFSKKAERQAIEILASLSTDGQVVLTVRDFGPGIPKDQMKKIFKLFYRNESELTRETVGTGIGLAIVHQLAVAMGGKVDVVNANPGAAFRVSFPA